MTRSQPRLVAGHAGLTAGGSSQGTRRSKLITGEQKFEYLDEHLPYVLKMLRYDFARMNDEQSQLDWNSRFQSFSVSARNLVAFLSNADKDNRNVRAGDFIIGGFRTRKGDISGPMNALDTQVFHLARNRSREADRKFDIENAKDVFEWIEDSIKQFREALPPKDQENWNAGKSKFSEDGSDLAVRVATGSGARSTSSSVTHTTITPLDKINATSSVGDFRMQER